MVTQVFVTLPSSSFRAILRFVHLFPRCDCQGRLLADEINAAHLPTVKWAKRLNTRAGSPRWHMDVEKLQCCAMFVFGSSQYARRISLWLGIRISLWFKSGPFNHDGAKASRPPCLHPYSPHCILTNPLSCATTFHSMIFHVSRLYYI